MSKNWKCPRCGGDKATTTRENEPFDEVLTGVVLVGVEVTRCGSCGNREVAIPRMEDLLKAVARLVVGMGGRLTGEEVRFLRTFLDLSGVELARLMDSTPGTVSRWENDRTPVGRTADLLLRTIVGGDAEGLGRKEHTVLDLVREIATKLDEKRRSTVYPFRFVDDRWEVVELERAGLRQPVRSARATVSSKRKTRAAR
jgi:putative zinc finger/helix-turn-helix YgiT family protein